MTPLRIIIGPPSQASRSPTGERRPAFLGCESPSRDVSTLPYPSASAVRRSDWRA